MNLYKCLNRTKAAFIWVSILLGISCLFIFSAECKNGAVNGILMCSGVLVPSLFPFFILSAFVSETGILNCLSPILNKASKLILGLNGNCLVPVILSLLGGYPVGAKSIASLYHKEYLTEEEAKRLTSICCSSGPGFLITFTGVSLLGSKESGIILLLSQIISVLIMCILSRFVFGKAETNKKVTNLEIPSISEALVNSVNSAVKSTAGMCGFVIVFSIICCVLTEGLGIVGVFGKIIVSLLEITTGVTLVSGELSLEILSALTGFGGLCVHLQIFRELKGIEFSKARFYIFRFIQSSLCLVTSKLLLLAFPVSDSVFSSVSETPAIRSYSGIAGTVALLITSVVFIISVRNKRIS